MAAGGALVAAQAANLTGTVFALLMLGAAALAALGAATARRIGSREEAQPNALELPDVGDRWPPWCEEDSPPSRPRRSRSTRLSRSINAIGPLCGRQPDPPPMCHASRFCDYAPAGDIDHIRHLSRRMGVRSSEWA